MGNGDSSEVENETANCTASILKPHYWKETREMTSSVFFLVIIIIIIIVVVITTTIAIGHAQTNGSNKNCHASHACKYHRPNGIEGEINSSQTMQNIPLGFVRVMRSNIALQENLHFGMSGRHSTDKTLVRVQLNNR